MATKNPIHCKTCDVGIMRRKKKYRLGAAGFIFGLCFGLPSLIGLMIGVLGLYAIGTASEDVTKEQQTEIRQQLEEAFIPLEIINKVMNSVALSDSDRKRLTDEQLSSVNSAILNRAAASVGAAAGIALFGGASLTILLMSLFGLMIAWLVTLKKKVLQCNQCGATVAAS